MLRMAFITQRLCFTRLTIPTVEHADSRIITIMAIRVATRWQSPRCRRSILTGVRLAAPMMTGTMGTRRRCPVGKSHLSERAADEPELTHPSLRYISRLARKKHRQTPRPWWSSGLRPRSPFDRPGLMCMSFHDNGAKPAALGSQKLPDDFE